MKTKFNVGDWVFCEFKLQQVKESDNGNVKCVTDGLFSLGSSSLNDRCFELSIRAKCISDKFESWSRQIHSEGQCSLNFPGINRWLIAKWASICRQQDDDEAVEAGLKETGEWVKNLLNRSKELQAETVGGICLFRQP